MVVSANLTFQYEIFFNKNSYLSLGFSHLSVQPQSYYFQSMEVVLDLINQAYFLDEIFLIENHVFESVFALFLTEYHHGLLGQKQGLLIMLDKQKLLWLFSLSAIIKIIMQESLRSSGRVPAPRISDKLEDIYSDEAHHFRDEQHLRKRLFSQIIQKSDERIQQKKELEKQLQRRENQQIDLFWRNEEQRRQQLSRKRKRDIDQVRRINNSELRQQLHKSMCDEYSLQKSFKDDLANFIASQRKKKQQRQRFYHEAVVLQGARLQRKRFEKQLDTMIDHKKQAQNQELNHKRQEYLGQWRQKHFEQHHPQTKRLFDQLNAKKQAEKSHLQELIAVKGGIQLNQRVAALRVAQQQQKALQKQQYMKQLKQQVQENTYKAAIDRYLELNYERGKMHEMSKALAERDQFQRQHKKEVNNEHLSVLRGQMKPRNLLPQPDKVQFAGIGSPAHIGKIVHEDRLKQLKVIERNFLKQVKQI